jgi:MFS family permease
MKDKIFGLQKNVFFLGLTSLFNDLSSEMILSILPAFFISVLKSGTASLGLAEGIADAAANFIKIYSGRLSDKIQKKKVFAVLGYSISVLVRPFYIFSSSVFGVIGLRLTDRIGKGLREAPRDALISLSSAKEEVGKSFGYHRAMDTIGAIIGPLVAYLILLRFPNGFNIIFITAFIVGLVAVASLLLVKEIKTAVENKNFSTKIFYKFPLQFKLFITSMFILSLGTLPVAVLLFRTRDIGFLIASIPLFYMIYSVSYAIFSLVAGKFADRVSKRKIIFVGYITLIIGYIILGFSHSLLTLVVGFLFVGIFSGFTDGVQRAYVANIIDRVAHGRAYGYLNAAIGFGALFAGIMGGYLWQAYGDILALAAATTIVLLGLLIFGLVRNKVEVANSY